MEQYDLIVIGAGPGGYVPAVKAAKAGRRVAVVDRGQPGGTCLNCGCIPTKTYLHTAGLYREAGQASVYGLCASSLTVDMKTLKEKKDQVVEELRTGIRKQFQMNHIDYYEGYGVVEDARHIKVRGGDETETVLEADYLLIASGSQPLIPNLPGADLPGIDTSTTLLDRESLYEHLVIIGGGVIGMEFATVYSDLGCKVTVIEAMDRILPGMDKEISQNLRMILKKRGVDIHASSNVQSIQQIDTGFRCIYAEKGKECMAESDGVLIAIGRKAVVEGVFSDEMMEQISLERGRIVVDSHYQTNVPGIYAAGDVTGGVQLANAATAQGCNAVAHMFGLPLEKKLQVIPGCVYTDPEIACAGITADEAKAAGIEVKTGKYLMSFNGKSVLTMQERGFVRLVSEAATGKLIGAQLMCARATDIIGMLALAIAQELTAAQAAETVLPHPTFCEAVGDAAEDMIL